MARAAATGLAATVASALPVARRMGAAQAQVGLPLDTDGTLQAFADTIIPGRKADKTELGHAIHSKAIAGVDPLPGAVETDSLALYHHPLTGFDALQGPFLADLQSRAAQHGGDFLSLPFDARVETVKGAVAFDNPDRLLYEAAAAVPFTAFCAAALIPEATAAKAAGYRVMGLPGAAPAGHRRGFSYRRKLSRERTKHGYLP